MGPNVPIIQLPYYKYFVSLILLPIPITSTSIGGCGVVFAGIVHPLKRIPNIVFSILNA